MTKLIFRWGREVKEATLKEGQRVLAGGYLLGYDEIGFGECGGSCVCSTCHVRVREVQGGQFAPAKREETELLDTVPVVHADSRLACQLHVTKDMQLIDVEWVG